MNLLFSALDVPGAEHLGEGTGEAVKQGAGAVSEQLSGLVGDPKILLIGLALVIITLVIIFFIKKIIINSVLGVVAWTLVVYVFQVEIPFIPSLVLSVIFGLAGIGSILVLKFLGISIPGLIFLFFPA